VSYLTGETAMLAGTKGSIQIVGYFTWPADAPLNTITVPVLLEMALSLEKVAYAYWPLGWIARGIPWSGSWNVPPSAGVGLCSADYLHPVDGLAIDDAPSTRRSITHDAN
jgi:hypothetical protein